ncbi:MAG TPA: hypothetical protein VJV79_00165 [Polyangiaceae bacterium]|nr:hypothetical protein [Polyangiaceae bacterium]
MAIGETSTDADFEQRFARIESLLAELSASADPLVERVTRELLATVLELHQRGLSRMLELSACDEPVREALARDTRVSAMLLLHGLHPLALDTRVSRAVAGLRDRCQDKLADVTVDLCGAAITLNLVPTESACGSTRATLKRDFEDALLAVAPDAESVSVQIAESRPALITLRLRREPSSEGAQGPR